MKKLLGKGNNGDVYLDLMTFQKKGVEYECQLIFVPAGEEGKSFGAGGRGNSSREAFLRAIDCVELHFREKVA